MNILTSRDLKFLSVACVITFRGGMAAAQTGVPTAVVPQPGCVADIQQYCAGSSSDALQQCLAAYQSNLSPSCQAALAQRPAAGISLHLGNDPTPTVPQPLPVDLPNFTPPQLPQATIPPTNSPPPPPSVSSTVILAPPPNAAFSTTQ